MKTVCIVRHLEYVDDIGNLRDLICQGCDVAVDYFFGDYLEKEPYLATRAKSYPDLRWLIGYRSGLLLSALGGDRACRAKLTSWLTPDVPTDPTFEERPPTYTHYYFALTAYLGGASYGTHASVIRGARDKGPKLLLSCLDAITAEDTQAFSKCLRDYLDHSFKREFCSIGIETFISIDASLLAMLAKENGLRPEGLTEKQEAVVMTPATVGIEGE